MKKILPLFLLGLLTLVSCRKYDYTIEPKGEALGTFRISAPNNNTMLVLNSATPNQQVKLSWTASTPGVSAAPTYKWVAIQKGGDFAMPYIELPSDNNGLAASLTLTYKQIDDVLKAKSIVEGVKVDLIWTVFANNGSVNIKSNDDFNISITRAGDGVSNFVLYGPLSSTTVLELNPNSTTEMLNFKWQKSVAGKAGSAVTYKIKFIKQDGNLNTPLMQFTSNNNGLDSAFSISYKDFDVALTAAGLADQATPASLKWSVEATSGAFTKFSDYVNQFSVKREVKMFMVGGDTPVGWNIDNAIQMIADASNPGTYYAYVKLNTGNGGFKFINQRQWPGGSLNAADWGMQPGSNVNALETGEDNIENYGPSGTYRVTFDQKNLKYYVQAGRMGAVGEATEAGWNPPNIFPTQGLANIAINKFLGIVTLSNGKEWKMIDSDQWPNGGGPVSQSRDFGKGAMEGVLAESGENNFTVPGATGMYRIIWDGSDVLNLKYSVTPGSVYLIGEATIGGWDNNAAHNDTQRPPMTYLGNGKWTITTNLTAGEFKFIVEKGSWDFNYGSEGNTNAIKEGGDNLKALSAGSYTITLDEYNRVYTLIKN